MHIFTNMARVILFTGLCLIGVNSFAQQSDALNGGQDDSSSVRSVVNNNSVKASVTVTDAATGKPISGVNIRVAGFSAAISGENGQARISVPNYDAVLLFSVAGYQLKEAYLKGKESISVKLYDSRISSVYDNANLPFGAVSKSRIPYAVSSISTNDVWGESTKETPDSYLQGKLAGLNVIRRSGTPSIGANMFLRGITSLYTTNQPLIVVDGMIYNNEATENSLFTGNTNNPIENIDLKDIEDITILKDAAAASYGTKGGNGVLLITTKRANTETTKIDFAAFAGVNSRVNNLPVMNAGDFRIYLAAVLQSQGLSSAMIQAKPYMNDAIIGNANYYTYHFNTDWQKEVINDSYNQNYHLNVMGGDNIAKYNLSLGYMDNGGIINNTNATRYFTRFNSDFRLTQNFRAFTNLAFSSSSHDLRNQGFNSTSPLYLALTKAPFMGVNEVNQYGSISPNYADKDIFSFSNPVALTENMIGTNNEYRVTATGGVVYDFNKKFKLQTLLGVSYDKIRERLFIPGKGVAQDTTLNAAITNVLGSNTDRLFALYNDTRGSYSYLSHDNNHALSANVGIRFKDDRYERDLGLTYNSATDDYTSLGSGNPTLRQSGGSVSNMRWLNTYFNADYSYKSKYFVSFNAAIDGSSRFGKTIPKALTINGNKLAVMPSIAAAWNLSSEDFLADARFINLLKVRASYGLVGNDDIGNYSAIPYYIAQNIYGLQGYVRGNVGNTNLKWETIEKLNAGVDLSLFDERLTASFDVYQSTTRDMLTYNTLSTISGFDYSISNGGDMRTNGFDLSVNARLVNATKLRWDLGLTISKYTNEITGLPANRILTEYGGATILSEKGRKANLFYGYKTDGIYASTTDAIASGLSNSMSNGVIVPLQGGDVRFVNKNNDAFIDEDDRVVIGDPNPDFTGMLRNALNYGNWSLDALFTFSSGNDIYNGTRARLESMSGYQNQLSSVNNRWRAEGQITNMPRASFGDPAKNSRFSDRWIEDGSYLRLRTLAVAYNIPVKANIALKSLKVFASANNVFTLTKYLGYDPEFSSSRSIFSQGIDIGLEPQFRSTQFGVRIGL